MRLVPTVSVVSKGYMHLSRKSCNDGGMCGRGPMRITGRFRTGNVQHLRIISLSKTTSRRIIGCQALSLVTDHASLVVSFNNKLGDSRSLVVTFRGNTRVIANNDVTIEGPSLFYH